MSTQPPFLCLPKSAVSGRLLSVGPPGSGDPTVPAVLEAHVLPGVIGSSVYILGAVGPSTSSWPFFPVGGAVMTGWTEMRRLTIADEAAYFFEFEESGFDWSEHEFELDPICEPEDLMERVLAFGRASLGLEPWDETRVSDVLESCYGWDCFDEFMALPAAEFPAPR